MASALVLKRFTVDPTGGSGEYIEIQGRKPGLIAFLLSMVGVDPTTVFKCSAERIEVKRASVFGAQSLTIPMAAITGIGGGYTKPVQYLAAAAGFFLVGLGALAQPGEGKAVKFAVPVTIGLVCLVLYMVKKQMGLYVQNGGDVHYGLEFNRSIIEGVDVDIERVNETIRVINSLVIRSGPTPERVQQRAA